MTIWCNMMQICYLVPLIFLRVKKSAVTFSVSQKTTWSWRRTRERIVILTEILLKHFGPWSQNFDILIHDPKIIFWSQIEIRPFTVDPDPCDPDPMACDSNRYRPYSLKETSFIGILIKCIRKMFYFSGDIQRPSLIGEAFFNCANSWST